MNLDIFETAYFLHQLACAKDEIKLWLSLSAKQHQNTCSRPPPAYWDLTHAVIG